jgi:sulfide:quinone oxidoreductase
MDIRKINDSISVAPQISPDDMTAIAELGFKTVINNRPDGEAPDQAPAARMEEAARAAGLAYRFVPVISGQLTRDNVDEFAATMADVEGPVLAYCRSGTRSATLWALSQAGKAPADEIVSQAAKAGYDMSPFRAALDGG